MELILPSLITALPILPLFLTVAVAVGFAAMKLSEIGRPARLVLIGGILVLVTLLINMITNASIYSLTRNYSSEVISMVLGISSFVTMIISTIGWGMILYAAFVDREGSKKLDF